MKTDPEYLDLALKRCWEDKIIDKQSAFAFRRFLDMARNMKEEDLRKRKVLFGEVCLRGCLCKPESDNICKQCGGITRDI